MKNDRLQTIDEYFQQLWKVYVHIIPAALRIHNLIEEQGDTVINDHIALRTFNHPAVNLEKLAQPFLDLGYQPIQDYDIPDKKLHARHFDHPDEKYPLVFISELKLEEFDENFREIIESLVRQIPAGYVDDSGFICSGLPWKVSHKTYLQLKEKSEYAAWLSAWGYIPNHFTVSVNHLNHINGIHQLNAFLKKNGVVLNSAGGEVKGSPKVFLEQSSTLAFIADVKFTDGNYVVPACYYEFAMRYPQPNGKFFRGFIPQSANKIFESTDEGQKPLK